ncbi:helix-turn-helix domain-containing protein [Megasphaera vaginalis (ex Bordigoni et al. 2020)]|uniref:helix-turn-helix domain-containing protein n=1 Tax=Megasphaera vaginalis (ex Bordigoni et al. 2020) TaxID=2045301 RepID=UPI000C7A3AC7|nr:XRE family transcriptional regulator [Megasphaera vaginalis (ex Bordigoni et al. 2020)]
MDTISENIGSNLKFIRKQRNLTLESLSAASGVSKSMISEIERGIRNPSISILWNLANTLKTPLNFFLKPQGTQGAVIYRPVATSVGDDETGCIYHPLMEFDESKGIELYTCTYQPGGCTAKQVHYAGVEEYAFIASGNITLHLPDENLTAAAGEVLHFPGDKPHWYSNDSLDTAAVFVMMYYPKL